MFNKQQFREFRLAQRNGVNLRLLENMDANQMRETRLAAQSKLDLSYFTPDVPAEKMNVIRNLLEIKAEIDPGFIGSFNAEQLKQIKLGLDFGLDVKQYQFPYLTAAQMRVLRIRLLATKVINYIKENGLSSIFSIVSFKSYNDPNLMRYTEKVIDHIESKNDPEKQEDHNIEDYVKNQFTPAVNEVHMDDVKLDDHLDAPEESKVKADHTLLARNTAFLNCALVSVSDKDFRVIKDYEDNKKIDDYPAKNVVKYDNAVSAAKDFQSIIMELEKDDVQFKLISQNMNRKEKVVMALHNAINEKEGTSEPEIQAFMVSLLKRHTNDLRQPLLKKICETSNATEVKKAAQEALKAIKQKGKEKSATHQKEQTIDKETQRIEKLIEKAQSLTTSSTKLSSIAEKNNEPQVLQAVLQNPNCSTTLINKYLDHGDMKVQNTAKAVLQHRSQMKSIQVKISVPQIIKEIPSHFLTKDKNPIMLSVIRLPDTNKYGIDATCVVPSSSIKRQSDHQAIVRLNPERTFEILVGKESKGMISGKELQQQLEHKNDRSLDERLNDARKELNAQHQEKAIEKQKETEKGVER